MKFTAYYITYLFLILISINPVHSQHSFIDSDGKLREMVLNPNIKTVQLYREGWPMSYPVVNLINDVPLVLEILQGFPGHARGRGFGKGQYASVGKRFCCLALFPVLSARKQ